MLAPFHVKLAFKLFILLIHCSVAFSTNARSTFRRDDIQNNTYDYVVVGGGITGLVVANRLTEDPHSKYL